MNTFFTYNLVFTLTIFFVPTLRISFSDEVLLDLLTKTLILSLLVLLVIFRGRTAIRVKNNTLYCYTYPLVRRFNCDEIKQIKVGEKKVTIKLKDSMVEVDYFFGIQGAIDANVMQRLQVQMG